MYYIYQIINTINNKSYIGFTANPKRRWAQHLIDCKNGLRKILYFAMRKYGSENFTFEVIYEHENREHVLLEMEPYYIRLFDTVKNGYNAVYGGINTNTDKMRKASSDRMKFNNPMTKLRHNGGTFQKGSIPHITEERNRKISESKTGSNNHNYGNSAAAKHLSTAALGKHWWSDPETNQSYLLYDTEVTENLILGRLSIRK